MITISLWWERSSIRKKNQVYDSLTKYEIGSPFIIIIYSMSPVQSVNETQRESTCHNNRSVTREARLPVLEDRFPLGFIRRCFTTHTQAVIPCHVANLYSKLKSQSTMLLSFLPFISYFFFLHPFYLDPWLILILRSSDLPDTYVQRGYRKVWGRRVSVSRVEAHSRCPCRQILMILAAVS